MYKELEKKGGEEKFLKAGVKARIIELLKTHKEEAQFSKMLATIRRDAPIEFTLPEKEWSEEVDTKKILDMCTEFDFRTLGARAKEMIHVLLAPTQGNFLPGDTTKENKVETQEEIQQKTIDENSLEFKQTAVALWVVDSNITNPTPDDIFQFTKKDTLKDAQEVLFTEIKKRNLQNVYENIELPLISVLEKMKKKGIKIDTKNLGNLSKKYHTELERIEKEIWKLTGEEFNIASPKQLGVILYEKLGLKSSKKTAGGARSTKESELQKLVDQHPAISLILEHRELSKLLGTYIDALPELLDKNFRVHATFLQAGSTTGRMASQNPGLQNIPIKTELGRIIRTAFVAEKGFKLVAFDYSQMELRIEIFTSGEDVHTAVAARVFGVPLEKVDKEMRRKAKVINFGIMYGMGINALKANLGTSREEAQKFYNEYFQKFSGLAEYLDRVKAETARKGYTETLFGRRRYFEGINSKLPFIKAMAERMAINAPIQGTEADIVKLAMIAVDIYIQKEGLEEKVFTLLQVHDELVYEIKEEEVKKVSLKIKKIMESVVSQEQSLGVPIAVEVEAGDNWGEMEEIK
jgi:DNA polymerase-1